VTPPNTFMPQTLVSGVLASTRAYPNKVALAEGERVLSYRNLADRMHKVACAALKSGFQPGDHIALMSPNCLEYPEVVLGLSLIGIRTVLINPRLTNTEIDSILQDSGAVGIIVHQTVTGLISNSCSGLQDEAIVIGDNYDAWRNEAPKKDLEDLIHKVQEWETFALGYTAGTTGKPKGVMLSHRSRVLTFLGMSVAYGCYSPDDRSLALAPMYHGAGFAFGIAPIFFGGFCEIMPKFDPEQVLHKLSYLELTNTFMVPTHFNAIFALGADVRSQHRFPALKTIISNAAPLPQATKEKIVDYFGDKILHETYGSTEACIVTNLRPQDQLRKIRCVGQPFPLTQIQLRNDQHREVGVGEVGELFSRSPYLFNGYWNQPDATSETFQDGWVSVGDLAVRDEEGFYYIVDRKKDVIISGGVNVYPREIEEVLYLHPAIAEAAVIGVSDSYWGESAKAFIVQKLGSNLSQDDLESHCRASLAGFKIPKTYEWIEALPRNAAGKVLKQELKKLTKEEL